MNGNIEDLFSKLTINENLNNKFSKFQLKDFKIEKEVGRGAYAKVYKAIHIETEKLYALKLVDIQLIQREKKIHHVFIELSILSEINHPFIANVHGLIKDDKKLIIILDYYPNGDLFDFLKEKAKDPLILFKYIS
jgi:serine/threonine protein kinase